MYTTKPMYICLYTITKFHGIARLYVTIERLSQINLILICRVFAKFLWQQANTSVQRMERLCVNCLLRLRRISVANARLSVDVCIEGFEQILILSAVLNTIASLHRRNKLLYVTRLSNLNIELFLNMRCIQFCKSNYISKYLILQHRKD